LFGAHECLHNSYLASLIRQYTVARLYAARNHPDVYLGASPRGSLALYKTSQAYAALQGREFVTPDDIKLLAQPTLAHRLILSPSARVKNLDTRVVIEEILEAVPVPGTRSATGGRREKRG